MQVETDTHCACTWIYTVNTVYALTFAGLNFEDRRVSCFYFRRWRGVLAFDLLICCFLWILVVLMQSIASVEVLNSISSFFHFCDNLFTTAHSLLGLNFVALNFRGWLLICENCESLTPQKLKSIQHTCMHIQLHTCVPHWYICWSGSCSMTSYVAAYLYTWNIHNDIIYIRKHTCIQYT